MQISRFENPVSGFIYFYFQVYRLILPILPEISFIVKRILLRYL